jgi:hypothetical protein
MKSFIYGLVLAVMLSGVAMAADYDLSSGNKTADALVYTGRAIITKLMISTDVTNNCSVALYGNTSAAGTIIFPAMTCIAASAGGCTTDMKVLAPFGIYADMTVGAGACTYNIHYQPY